MKKVAGRLRLELAQYRELEAFAQFGSDLDPATQKRLQRGSRLTELLKQGQYNPVPWHKQVVAIYAGINGYLDDIPLASVQKWEKEFLAYCDSMGQEMLGKLEKTRELTAEIEEELKGKIDEFRGQFQIEEQ